MEVASSGLIKKRFFISRLSQDNLISANAIIANNIYNGQKKTQINK